MKKNLCVEDIIFIESFSILNVLMCKNPDFQKQHIAQTHFKEERFVLKFLSSQNSSKFAIAYIYITHVLTCENFQAPSIYSMYGSPEIAIGAICLENNNSKNSKDHFLSLNCHLIYSLSDLELKCV